MKKINKIVFLVVLICGIIGSIVFGIYSYENIRIISNESDSQIKHTQDIVSDGEVEDVEGYAAIIYGGVGILGIIVQFLFIGLVIMAYIIVAIYIILYLISWLINIKNESRAKIVISLVLNTIGMIIQIFIINILIRLCVIYIGYEDVKNVLLLATAIVSEIASVLFTIIYYIINMNKIKDLYNSLQINRR